MVSTLNCPCKLCKALHGLELRTAENSIKPGTVTIIIDGDYESFFQMLNENGWDVDIKISHKDYTSEEP